MEIDEIERLNGLLKIYINGHVDKQYSVLSKNADPFFILNRAGQLVYVNDLCETLLEYSRSNLLYKKLDILFDSSLLNKTQTFFIEKDLEILNNFDSKIHSKTGDIIYVNLTTFPLIFNEEIVGSYVVLKDISLVKRESQLISQKQAIAGQLAAGIAHEIRNPITAIKGFLQLMMEDHEEDSMYFNIIDSEIGRIEEILKELMILAKPTKILYKTLDIQLLLEQVLTLMESHALLNDIEFEKSFNLNGVMVLGDENQLKQVFINYIKNAIESMTDGGNLKVEGLCFNQKSAQIRIIDQGCGIPVEIIDRIHEPFFTTKEHGNGLGMSVCYQIIEEHKGKVNIKSNSDGTCIEVILPVTTT